VELRLARLRARGLRGAAIATGGRHRLYLSPFSATVMAAWLTQGPQPDKDVTLRVRPRLWACGGGAPAPDGGGPRPGRGRCRAPRRRPSRRADVASLPAAHRRSAGTYSAAPRISVIKPGNTSRIPPITGATPGVSRWIARIPSRAKALRTRSRSARPDFRNSSTPATEVATKRAGVHSQPISAATRMSARNSAAGSAASPIKVHLTNDIGPFSCIGARRQPCWRHGWDRLWSGMRGSAPVVRRKPLDQCGRVLTYWYGNRCLPSQISHLPAFH